MTTNFEIVGFSNSDGFYEINIDIAKVVKEFKRNLFLNAYYAGLL